MASSVTSQESVFGAHLVRQLDMPFRMINALAEDFTDEQARESVGGQKPLVWYLAHSVITKTHLLKLYGGAGDSLSKEFIERYGRGSDGSADFSDAPPKAEFLEHLAAVHERAKSLVASLAPEDMERKAEGEIAHPVFKKLGSALTLIASHDAYHAGQIAVLRRSMGKDPIFG
jgi:hypothetical protein